MSDIEREIESSKRADFKITLLEVGVFALVGVLSAVHLVVFSV